MPAFFGTDNNGFKQRSLKNIFDVAGNFCSLKFWLHFAKNTMVSVKLHSSPLFFNRVASLIRVSVLQSWYLLHNTVVKLYLLCRFYKVGLICVPFFKIHFLSSCVEVVINDLHWYYVLTRVLVPARRAEVEKSVWQFNGSKELSTPTVN